MSKIKILLVDDQPIIRNGLKSVIDSIEDMEVVGEANHGREAYILASQKSPDIILMDIRMPIMDGVEATRVIKKDFPHIKIIMLTTFDDDQYIIQAISYGASGYLLKDVEMNQLIDSMRDSLSNHIILPGKIASKIVKHIPMIDHHLTKESFTSRELDIINLLVNGESNLEIANKLYLSIGTVKNYLSNIYAKLDVYDRVNAIIQLKKIGF
ncbi:MAG: response regulator transcription factor [Acholeplasmataceae bacterium]|jgi:DNA-binding NarL/FixJ family response regulator|nr:response regulator transcription factor [Acholeplasmataceae bacterium]